VNNNFIKKLKRRIARKRRCRARIRNQNICRLTVYRSSKHVYAQIFSSDSSIVLVSASSIDKDSKKDMININKTVKSQLVGQKIAEKAKIKGISKVAFDKSGLKYHGCIKAVADSARKNGLSF